MFHNYVSRSYIQEYFLNRAISKLSVLIANFLYWYLFVLIFTVGTIRTCSSLFAKNFIEDIENDLV